MSKAEFWWMQNEQQQKGWTEHSRSGWYNTKEWKELRQLSLAESPLCKMCEAEGKLVPAKEVDHIIPVSEDESKFFDLSNLQPLCKFHHRRKTRQKNSRYSRLKEGEQLKRELENW